MDHEIPSELRRYGAAALAVLSALLLDLLVWPWARPTAVPLFTVAVLFSAWHGGLGPGLFASALAAVAGRYFFVPPYYKLTADSGVLIRLVMFSAIAAVTAYAAAARRRSDRARREAEGRYRLMIENVRDHAIFMLDPRGLVSSWDVGAERLLGYTGPEVVGRPASLFFTAEDVRDGVPEQALRRAEAEGRSEDERWHVRKDGSRFFASGVVNSVRDEAGRLRGFAEVMRDVTARKRAEDALREREGRLRRFAESDIIGINFADVHGQITFANDAYLRLTGYSRADLLAGRVRWTDLTPPEWLYTDERAIAEATQRGTCTPFEKEYVRKDGTRVPVLVGFVLLDDAREEGVAFVLDLTERKQAERSAQEAREAAEAANRAKDAFLAALSHELRTPLTPALIALPALESDPRLPADLRDEVAMIRRNVVMEARLIDDLLDLTRIAQGKMHLHVDAVDSHAKIRNALDICQGEINRKRLRVSLGLHAGRHFVRADPGRLQQVLWNLVSNAVKFTPEGGQIGVTTEDAPGDRLRVRVSDTGIGILPETLPRVFDAFEQGQREFGGLGLGLAIAKRLVEAHGGTLTAASEGRGRGAAFTVELADAMPPPEAAPVPPPGDTAEGGRRPLRILLVEDHRDTLRALARLLRSLGHEPSTAETLASGLEAAAVGDFDLLISDIGLPDGSGCELMSRLSPLPGIALTGFGMDGDVRKTREAGFVTHLTKPVDPRQLEEAIEAVAGSLPNRRSASRTAPGCAAQTG
jgi:PAS domain S-box-containing protein